MQHPHTGFSPRPGKSCSGSEIRARTPGAGSLILGAVLAGGQSSRFGSDKASALFGGATLATHAAALLAPVVNAVITIGRDGIADLPEAGLGPLGGIAAALDHAASRGYVSVVTIGCDMPQLPAGLLDRLLRRAPTYCADAPVLGHWPSALGAQLLAHIASAPDRSVRRWAHTIGALPIHSPTALVNINTPADLAAL